MREKRSLFWATVLHNLGIKLLSLFGAVLVWMIIINIDDPYKSKNFQVEVETINADALKSVNKVYEVIEGGVANVRVGGKRSVIDKLDATDIRATADLSNLSSVNAVAIEPSLRKKVSSEVTLECSQVLKVSLENMATKQVKVAVVADGRPADGYTIGECTAKPNMIQISGGESVIEQIELAKVFLNVNGVSNDFTAKLVPKAYDDNGKEVKSSTLSFSSTKIRVKAKVLENKMIPVRVEVTGTPAEGYEYVETQCLPEEVEVAGTPKRLASVSELVVPVDIEGMTSSSANLEQNINVADYLAEGITVTEEYEMVSLKITIEQLVSRNIEISADDLKFQNLGENLVAEALNANETGTIIVSGRSSVLDALPDTAFTPYVDCKGRKPGIHTLPVLLELGDTCEIVEKATFRIRITRVQGTENNTAVRSPKPEPTATHREENATPVPEITAVPEESMAPSDEEPDHSEE